MDKYKKNEMKATIYVAFFIVNFALCMLAQNRSVYSKSYDAYYDSLAKAYGEDIEGRALEKEAAKKNYNVIASGFSRFFKSDYSGTSEKLSERNVQMLGRLKTLYRLAWILSIVTFVGAIRCFVVLSKRREYMPFLYGGALSAVLAVIGAVIIALAGGTTLSGIRNMIMHGDYTYFPDTDILRFILPPNFGMCMALAYLVIVFGLILCAALIRLFIIFLGRPHKF